MSELERRQYVKPGELIVIKRNDSHLYYVGYDYESQRHVWNTDVNNALMFEELDDVNSTLVKIGIEIGEERSMGNGRHSKRAVPKFILEIVSKRQWHPVAVLFMRPSG